MGGGVDAFGRPRFRKGRRIGANSFSVLVCTPAAIWPNGRPARIHPLSPTRVQALFEYTPISPPAPFGISSFDIPLRYTPAAGVMVRHRCRPSLASPNPQCARSATFPHFNSSDAVLLLAGMASADRDRAPAQGG